ncbi:PREDICTED: uncharacterized protein LOC105571035 [Vollenhovia emeryi]|uniref:uncharacterized protein LOC105571035 n=1 Tax=Vollenhovia emeryi TaxID=411798 RepID=UPI0005F42820|nr:PREDICTED: uncharacterized protein LOC105571035 [Vollenhovia emeryi]
MKVLQVNLNRSRLAQDMFLHSMAERGCGLGIAAEPNRVPRHPCWAGSEDGSVAITWRRIGDTHVHTSKIGGGEGWVAVKWGPLVVLGIYLRPSLSRYEYEDRLKSLEEWIRDCLPAPLMVAGDFNVKSALWGSRRPDAKGGDLVEWATRLGLHLHNVGTTSTCVRPQGESIIDLTWSSPAAARWVTSWRVAEELEILSDHLPIEVELRRDQSRRPDAGRPLRWAARKLDPDRLTAALVAATWTREPGAGGIEEKAAWLRETMTAACDAAMPRATFAARKAAYWWTEEINDLRKASVRARRALQRERRRRTPSRNRLEELHEEYRERRAEIRLAIKKSRERVGRDAPLPGRGSVGAPL